MVRIDEGREDEKVVAPQVAQRDQQVDAIMQWLERELAIVSPYTSN